MDNFQIETAQNISIQQNVAHVTTRIGSYLIDGLIIFGYIVLLNIIFASMDYEVSIDNITPYLLCISPILFYSLGFETFMNGQTPGKMVNKIRVVKLDGSKPTFGSYLTRWMIRLIDINAFVGSVAIFSILLNGKGQRLGDIAAGTTVISEKKRIQLKDTLVDCVQDQHEPSFPQVTMLNDQDIQKIRQLYKDAVNNRKHKVILKLSIKIKEVTGITSDLKPMVFVDTIIKDYYYYTQQ